MKCWNWKRYSLANVKYFCHLWPHGMCYSHFGDEVRNGAIFIIPNGVLLMIAIRCPVGQWGKILVMAIGFVDNLGHVHQKYPNGKNFHICEWIFFSILTSNRRNGFRRKLFQQGGRCVWRTYLKHLFFK